MRYTFHLVAVLVILVMALLGQYFGSVVSGNVVSEAPCAGEGCDEAPDGSFRASLVSSPAMQATVIFVIVTLTILMVVVVTGLGKLQQ